MIANREEGNSGAAGVDGRDYLAGALGVLAVSFALARFGAGPAALLSVAMVGTWILVPIVGRFARGHGVEVTPGGRSVHVQPTPLLGGLAIALPLLAGLVALGGAWSISLAGACIVVVAAGVFDDVRGLRAAGKIVAQVVAGLVLFWGGHRVGHVLCPPLGVSSVAGLELPLLVFWVLLVTNAVNLMDGLDGLAAGVCLIAAAACLLLGGGGLPAILLVGSLLGFLRFNLPRARVFLGDTGSLLLGLLVAVLLLREGRGFHLPLAIGLLALPLGEVTLSTARRMLRGRPVFAADRGHVHHLLLLAWRSPSRALAGLIGLAALQALVVVLLPNVSGVAIILILWAAFLGYLLVITRARWQRILAHRGRFQLLHLLSRHASMSLRLAKSRTRVQMVLARVAEDLGISELRLGDLEVDRPEGNGAAPATAICGGRIAFWRMASDDADPVFDEERRTVLHGILEETAEALDRLERRAREKGVGMASPGSETGARDRDRARAHFIVRRVEDLIRIAPVVRAFRDRGSAHAVVVNAARRDDLDVSRMPTGVEPHVDLDVPVMRDVVETGRVMERYDELLGVMRPDLIVVVGESNAAVACALVARRRRIPLAHFDGREAERSLAASIADLCVAEGSTGSPLSPRHLPDANPDLVAPRLEELMTAEASS